MVPTGPLRIVPEIRRRDDTATRAALVALDELWVVTDELRRIETRLREIGNDKQTLSLIANERETWWASAISRLELLGNALERMGVDADPLKRSLARVREHRPRSAAERIALLDAAWAEVDATLKAGPPPELSDDTGYLENERKKHGRWAFTYFTFTSMVGTALAFAGGGPKVVSRLVVVFAACAAGAVYETMKWHKIRSELEERKLLNPHAR